MRQDHNPVVVALEIELKQTRAKLEWMEKLYGDAYGPRKKSDSYSLDGYNAGEITLSSMRQHIQLTQTAEITAALELNHGGISVTARTSGKDQIGIQYFVSDCARYQTRDQVALLGHLHESFNQQLAGFMRKHL